MNRKFEKLLRVVGIGALDAKILAALYEKPMSPAQISSHLNLHTKTVYTRLALLREKGLVYEKLKLYRCRMEKIRERIQAKKEKISRQKNALRELEILFSPTPNRGMENDGAETDDGRDTDS